jgi:hypothetical protein
VLGLGLLTAALGVAFAEESDGERAIREAITVLEGRKAQAAGKADQEQIAAAIAALERLLTKKAGGKADEKGEISPALLRKKLAGKAAVLPATKELSIVYDFGNKDQLRDFEAPKGAAPKVARGTLLLEAGEEVTHVVKFKTLTLVCQLAAVQPKGVHLSTTTGITLSVVQPGNYLAGNLNVARNDGVGQDGTPAGRVWPVELKILPTRVAAKLSQLSLGKATANAVAGQVKLHGGEGGNAFGKLVLTGEVDEDWARGFFVP